MSVIIALPFATPSQNEYQRWHWTRRHRYRNECCLAVRVGARKAGWPYGYPPTKRMMVEIIRHSAGTLDHGNLVGGCKPLLDAMVHERLLVDDSGRWLADEYRQSRAPAGKGHTHICITPC